jgi:ketosteroid isomerase-like protein
VDSPGVVTPPDCSPHVRDYLMRVAELFAAGDLDEIMDLVTDDVEFHDHRPLGAEPIVGAEGARVWLGEMITMIPDWRIRVDVLEQSGDLYLARDTYFGEGTEQGIGAAETEWYVIDLLRDGKLAREEIFEHEDQARAAYESVLAG